MAFQRILDPMERISEVLFGVIMALTFTLTLGVATADGLKVRAMLLGALGCNLAWGIIDGGVYLLAKLHDQGRKLSMLREMRKASDLRRAQSIVADALPPVLASIVPVEQLESIRKKLHEMPEPRDNPKLNGRDLLGASGICLLSFLSTFPIIIPFMLMEDARLALRASNIVAIAMLAFCGYVFGYRSGLRPWTTALSMVAIGSLLVGIAIALGG